MSLLRQLWQRVKFVKLPRWAQIVLILASIGLVILLAYLLKSLLRAYVLEPIIYTVHILRLVIEALPQQVWWGIFVVVLALFSLRSLRYKNSFPLRRKRSEADRPSQASVWTNMVEMAASGQHSNWLLARQVARLAVDIIAHQERLSVAQARADLQAGKIDLPAEIQAYLQMGLDIPSFSRYSDFLPRARNHQGDNLLDMDAEIVLEYLEKRISTGGLM